ncbi:TRADD-N-associated membrane domain-containing protein [Streptomyces sp. NPDC054904]
MDVTGVGEWLWVIGAGVLPAVALVVFGRLDADRFERGRDRERARLLASLAAEPESGERPSARDPRFVDAGANRSGPAELGDRRDDFTPILVEYYAYGLTQARSSFATSQLFAAVGAAVLLFGVGLAVWKAESTGDAYIGVVTSSVGLVVTLVGQLFHRRADIALRHMAAQTASLREDRRAAESTQQAIGLLEEVADPELRARLQAGLIMKLSGAELPR